MTPPQVLPITDGLSHRLVPTSCIRSRPLNQPLCDLLFTYNCTHPSITEHPMPFILCSHSNLSWRYSSLPHHFCFSAIADVDKQLWWHHWCLSEVLMPSYAIGRNIEVMSCTIPYCVWIIYPCFWVYTNKMFHLTVAGPDTSKRGCCFVAKWCYELAWKSSSHLQNATILTKLLTQNRDEWGKCWIQLNWKKRTINKNKCRKCAASTRALLSMSSS